MTIGENACVRERQSTPSVAGAAKSVGIRVIDGLMLTQLKAWTRDRPAPGPSFVLGHTELPLHVGRVVAMTSLAVLCVGPAEWLLVGRSEVPPLPPVADLAAVDLTHAYCSFEISGHRAAELLSKGCALDFDLRVFPEGSCARTRFARVQAVMHRIERGRFEVHAGRSYQAYLQTWLEDSAAEWCDPEFV